MPDPQPNPTDPAPQPTPPAPADPPPADPPADPDPNDPGNDDPRVKRANAQAANYRTQLRAEQEARQALEAKLTEQGETLSKLAAVFNPDANPTDDPAQQLQAITAEAEALRTEVTTLRAELAVHDLAADNGGNPKALLDSRTFMTALQALDASAADHRDQVARAIKAAVESNANLSATGPAPAKGGAPGAGQGSADGGVTQEQFNAMGLADRSELYRTDPDTYRRLADSIR